LKAIPTDYDGTRFRSKSEAILARAMDLAEISWMYEPEEYDGYLPDFAVDVEIFNMFKLSYLIEYKPSLPSDAYIEKLNKIKINDPYDGFFIVYGNMYSPNKGLSVIPLGRNYATSEIACFYLCFIHRIVLRMTEALTYRFDLAAKLRHQ
jgi:hypothetical protein